MKYNNVLKELYSKKEWKFKLSLVNMKLLLKKLGNPEKKLKCIHVGGTNGKGSVCAMINSILTDAGYKVGMYTSPHLKKFNERIRINNTRENLKNKFSGAQKVKLSEQLITDKEIVKYYLKVKKHVTNQTFFEITTAMMFLYFFDKKVDFAVLEVGLGGRLDSTNVIIPLISVITNIGYEHTDRLGKKLEKIAFEKSGIIKENVPVVTGADGIALKIIKKKSKEKNSKLTKINSIKKIKLGLSGNFQLKNAALAIKTLEILNKNNLHENQIFSGHKKSKGFSREIKINKKNIENGLKNAEWPGRFQFIRKNILVDCSHNPDGFKILFNELKNLQYDKLILIIGFLKDKDIKKISKIIKADKIILVKPKDERSAEPLKIKKYFNNPIIINDTKKALKYAKKISNKKDLILVAGSIYVVGEII